MKSDPIPADQRAELWLDQPKISRTSTEYACRLDFPDGASHRVWFRFPAESAALVTRAADPFVVAVLLHAMARCRELLVHGRVSAGLISNLSNFQEAFSAYHVGRYAPIRIESDDVDEPPQAPRTSNAITAFSGGVDGAFSIFRHTSRSRIVPKRPLHAALLMHGLDVSLDEADVFSQVAARCRALAADAGIVLHTGSTNLRTLPVPWEDHFGSAVAASLLFFQSAFTHGLIPSAYSYGLLHPDHGSNPLTDPLLSSPLMNIVHDGAAYGRIEKLQELSAWPDALSKLRVCWQPGRSDNCCRCEKCIRTRLMLDLCGIDSSAAFPEPLSTEDIESLVIRTSGGVNELIYLLREATVRRKDAPWIGALARAVARNRRYLRLQATARSAGDAIPDWLRTRARSLASRILVKKPKPQKVERIEPGADLPLSKSSL